jgi:hypothetical protein
MAGAGVKLFLSGEIAYAADINQYLMDQSVALFLNEAARNSAFGNGIPVTQAGGDGKPLLTAGRICFLLEGPGSTVGNPIRTIQYYDGSTWVDSAQFTVPDGAITSAKLNTSLTLTGTTTFGQIVEKATTDTSTVLSPTVTHVDILSGAVYRFTNAGHTTGFKLNLRGNGTTPTSLSSLMTLNTQAITVCISVVSGASAISFAAADYLTIGTDAVTIKWFGGIKPSGNVNSEDFYTFTIFKTGASAFTVFASQSKFA